MELEPFTDSPDEDEHASNTIYDVIDAIRDEETLQVNDGAEIPTDYNGLALIVNERGNATLVECHGPDASGEFCETVEIWSVV